MNRGLNDMHRIQELVRLHRLKTGARAVARRLKMSPNTERSYRRKLEAAGLLKGDPEDLPSLEALQEVCSTDTAPPPQERSTAESWREQLTALWKRKVGPTAAHAVLSEEHGEAFDVSLPAVKRFFARLRREAGPRPEDVAIPVVTAPGEIAQIDFMYVGMQVDPSSGRSRKAWLFVMVLAHSRHVFAKVVFDQTVQTWLALHVEAFRWFGGVPKVLVPDNLKAAVIRAAFAADAPVALNRSYRELARHHGCQIDPTPPYQPQKKGKVERTGKYIVGSYVRPRSFRDVDALNEGLADWVMHTAGLRVHGTTGRRPLEVFEEVERAALLPLPTARFRPTVWAKVKVRRDGCVVYDGQRFSVPFKHLGQTAMVRTYGTSVEIHVADRRVATHDTRHPGPYIRDEHYPEGRRDQRHRDRAWWEAKADEIGPEVGAYIRGVFDEDPTTRPLRRVASLLRTLQDLPAERAAAVSRRAAYFGAYRVEAVRRIVREGLDLQPLPSSSPMSPQWATSPRFARSAGSFLSSMEVGHGGC